MTNKEFIHDNPLFRKACQLAKIKATTRQASKYRRGFGLAITKKRLARTLLNQERIRLTNVS